MGEELFPSTRSHRDAGLVCIASFPHKELVVSEHAELKFNLVKTKTDS